MGEELNKPIPCGGVRGSAVYNPIAPIWWKAPI